MFDAILFDGGALTASEEFDLGLRELRSRIPARRWWNNGPDNRVTPAGLLAYMAPETQPDRLLVILDPALLVSDNMVEALIALTPAGQAACSLPADPRDAAPHAIDYASRPGFDRYVARRADLEPARPRQFHGPAWVYMITLPALRLALTKNPEADWLALPELLAENTLVAQRAFIHSWSNYQQNTRSEMLDLLPANLESLLDVGGGEGGFAATVQQQKGCRVALAELNPLAAEKARQRGLEVHCGPFEALENVATFHCVSFLDVLEHLQDPFGALMKARNLIVPGGYLLLSVPNVGHWSVVQDLLEGEFDYQPVGILCVGHLRFFTRKGLGKLIEGAGYEVVTWRDQPSPMPAALANWLEQGHPGMPHIDRSSLSTDSFHVLLRKR